MDERQINRIVRNALRETRGSKRTYTIDYTFSGSMDVEAESETEAREMFENGATDISLSEMTLGINGIYQF